METVHVQMAPRRHKLYQRKVEDVCVSCVERLAWLKGGSRELFGTLLENKVVVVVDTSFSLKERLPLIKHKVKQLLEVSRPILPCLVMHQSIIIGAVVTEGSVYVGSLQHGHAPLEDRIGPNIPP